MLFGNFLAAAGRRHSRNHGGHERIELVVQAAWASASHFIANALWLP